MKSLLRFIKTISLKYYMMIKYFIKNKEPINFYIDFNDSVSDPYKFDLDSYRIVALRDFSVKVDNDELDNIENKKPVKVKKGYKGGYIPSYKTIDQDSWVAAGCRVFGKSAITHSVIRGNCRITDSQIHNTFIDYESNHQIYKSNINSCYVTESSIEYSNISFMILTSSRIENFDFDLDTGLKLVGVTMNSTHSRIFEFIDEYPEIITINGERDYLIFKNNFSSNRHFMYIISKGIWLVGCFTGSSEDLLERAKEDESNKHKYLFYKKYVDFVRDLVKTEYDEKLLTKKI